MIQKEVVGPVLNISVDASFNGCRAKDHSRVHVFVAEFAAVGPSHRKEFAGVRMPRDLGRFAAHRSQRVHEGFCARMPRDMLPPLAIGDWMRRELKITGHMIGPL